MITFPSRNISITIKRSPPAVYAFASMPTNLPNWATGLGTSVTFLNGDWIAESPLGTVKIRFVDSNEFGVLDHEVLLPTGERFFNPMRAVSNGAGCEVIFTLYRHPGTSDEKFEEDTLWVKRDLEKLKHLLER